ncbi:cell division topological specificity factor MinE [bacterium]|nr:cell division topological specificity factor MinE [bacterium]
MSIFTDIYNTVAKFFRQSDEPVIGEASKAVAANRLKLVLMQDRTNLTPKVLEQMRGEMIDLLSKYLEMDKDMLELNFEQEGDQVALMLSIPVIRAKDEEEIEAAIAKEDTDITESNSEEDSDEDNEEEIVDLEEEIEEDVVDEESTKSKKRSSKKVSAPEELQGNHENVENMEEQSCELETQQEVVCENQES